MERRREGGSEGGREGGREGGKGEGETYIKDHMIVM